MKKIALTTIIFSFSLSAFAGLSPYIAIRGGYERAKITETIQAQSLPQADINADGYALSLAAGLNLGQSFRGEIAYTYKNSNNHYQYRDSAGIPPSFDLVPDVKQRTLLINGYFYPLKNHLLNPFVGAGAGLGSYKNPNEDVGADVKNRLAYAVYLGIDLSVLKHFSVELMGTYNGILANNNKVSGTQNYGGSLGIRYNF